MTVLMSDVETIVREANGLCREAHEIAGRRGEKTDWSDLSARLEAAIERQKRLLRDVGVEEEPKPSPAAY